jgi:hypothetical protein
MVAEFMRQCGAPPARVDLTIDYSNAYTVYFGVGSVGRGLTQRQGIGEEANAFDMLC